MQVPEQRVRVVQHAHLADALDAFVGVHHHDREVPPRGAKHQGLDSRDLHCASPPAGSGPGSGRGHGETRRAKLGDHRRVSGPCQQFQAEPGSPDPFAAHRCGDRFKVHADRVKVGGVAQAELQVDRRSYPDELGDLVMTHQPADVVGRFHVQVDGDVHGGPDGCEVGKIDVGGQVQRAGAQVLQQPGRGSDSQPASSPRSWPACPAG